MSIKKKSNIITTKDGQRFRVRITYEVIALKTKRAQKGTVLLRGKYISQKDIRQKVNRRYQPKKRADARMSAFKKQYRQQTQHGLYYEKQLRNFKELTSRRKLPHKGQIGALFAITYQLNGERKVHDKIIEDYSRRTDVPITQLSNYQILQYLEEAKQNAQVAFLQATGLETADVVLIEIIPPIRFKYYVP